MPAYCFFNILEVNDPAKMEDYRSRVAATVDQYGGRYLISGGKFDVLEGDWQPVFPVMIEFPSLEQAHPWYDSQEYHELKKLRLAATTSSGVFMEGL
jgi:uncharacterized protein (DUF1330 family)